MPSLFDPLLWIVIYTVGNGFLFIYFHFCKFYAILIENELYICPIKLKQPHHDNYNKKI